MSGSKEKITVEARKYDSMTFEVQVEYDPHRQLGGTPHYKFKVRNKSTGSTLTEGGWCTSRKGALGAGWEWLDRVMGTGYMGPKGKQKWSSVK